MDPSAFASLLARLDKTCASIETQSASVDAAVAELKAERERLVAESKELATERKRLGDLCSVLERAAPSVAAAAASAATSAGATTATSASTLSSPFRMSTPSSGTGSSTSSGAGSSTGSGLGLGSGFGMTTPAAPVVTDAQWFYADSGWQRYARDLNRTVESNFSRGTASFTAGHYVIDIANRVQTRTSTGVKRALLRGTWFFWTSRSVSQPFDEPTAARLETALRAGSFPASVDVGRGRQVTLNSATSYVTSDGLPVTRGASTAFPGAAATPSRSTPAAPVAALVGSDSDDDDDDDDADGGGGDDDTAAKHATVTFALPGGGSASHTLDPSAYCHDSVPLMGLLRAAAAKHLSCPDYEVHLVPWLDWAQLPGGITVAQTASVRVRSSLFNITVKTLTGKSLALKLCAEDDALAVKQLVAAADGIPVDQQRLIFAGYQLADNRTVASYNIQVGAQLHLVLRLRGD